MLWEHELVSQLVKKTTCLPFIIETQILFARVIISWTVAAPVFLSNLNQSLCVFSNFEEVSFEDDIFYKTEVNYYPIFYKNFSPTQVK